jgi:NAD(P)-dependent dehydrogenase (short-subunit alcohol dehydrogenase family)
VKEKTEMAEQKVWIVTGSSRGLGRAIAEGVLELGDVVVATTARKTSDVQELVNRYGD